jgi:hypothetical protein
MGPGHLGIAFAAKRAAPRAPLWVLLVSSETLDLLHLAFAVTGIEEPGVWKPDFRHGVKVISPSSIPWSHGLFMSVVWSGIGAVIANVVYRDRRTSMMVGAVIFSHWALDFIVRMSDLPLFLNGSRKVGLGLWKSGPGLVVSVILELALIAGGMAVYLAGRRQAQAANQVTENERTGI